MFFFKSAIEFIRAKNWRLFIGIFSSYGLTKRFLDWNKKICKFLDLSAALSLLLESILEPFWRALVPEDHLGQKQRQRSCEIPEVEALWNSKRVEALWKSRREVGENLWWRASTRAWDSEQAFTTLTESPEILNISITITLNNSPTFSRVGRSKWNLWPCSSSRAGFCGRLLWQRLSHCGGGLLRNSEVVLLLLPLQCTV